MAAISVTVSDDHLARIDEVAAALREKGMQVSQVHERVGVISGSVPDDRRESLEALDGVEAVEDEVSFRLPPPSSRVQ